VNCPRHDRSPCWSSRLALERTDTNDDRHIWDGFFTLPFALLLVYLPEALWGRSIGKLVFGLRIEASQEARWTRYLFKTSGLLGITLAFIIGSWELTVISTGVGIVILLGFFLSLGKDKKSLHDLLAGTTVVSIK